MVVFFISEFIFAGLVLSIYGLIAVSFVNEKKRVVCFFRVDGILFCFGIKIPLPIVENLFIGMDRLKA